jgi:Holliday junction resolvase RusA-like endonuclease
VIAAPTPRVDLDPRSIALAITVQGEPVPKERPRVGRRGTRTPEKTRTWEQVIAIHARRALGASGVDGRSIFGVALTFVSGDRRARDIDNLVKLVFDSLNKLLWRDDCQVQELHARLVRGCANARTEILAFRIAPQEDDGAA